MIVAFFLSMVAAMAVAFWALVKSYGVPHGWSLETTASWRGTSFEGGWRPSLEWARISTPG